MSSDMKWMIGMVVAAVVATGVGIATVMVALVWPQLSLIAHDMRGHERRVERVERARHHGASADLEQPS